jgi:hypothetical protein
MPDKAVFRQAAKLRQHFARTAVDRDYGPQLPALNLSRKKRTACAEQHVHRGCARPHVHAGVKVDHFLQVVGLRPADASLGFLNT